MKIDSHQHFWKFFGNEKDYVWMMDEYSLLKKNFDPEDLIPLLNLVDFDGTVAVQAREMPKENDYLLDLAKKFDFIKGVVGWLDLCDPKIENYLERYDDQPKLKGLRMLIHDRLDLEFASSPNHVRGVGLLERHGLTYDLLLKPQHIRASTALVDHLPNQKFVIDHIAKPDIKMGLFEPWGKEIAALAERPNVYCKLSSLITQADWNNWSEEQFEPYLDHVLESFGPSRVMIGSDWPVCTCVTDYVTTMGMITRWAAKLSDTERMLLFGDNCVHFYCLEGSSL